MEVDLPAVVQRARAAKHKIVLVTGVFDMLHDKHREFLTAAKKLGDLLLVGVESDLRVRQMKGDDRPHYPQDIRVRHLQELGTVDVVFILPNTFGVPEEREKLMALIRPDFLAVSSHSFHQEAKQALAEKYGGQLKVVLEHDPRYSSTQILEKMTKGKE